MSCLNSATYSIPIQDMGFRVIFGGFGTGQLVRFSCIDIHTIVD